MLDADQQQFLIKSIYKLPEYKIIKMVRITQGAIDGQNPTKTTYLKPTQYLRIGDRIIKAKDLVEKMSVAEYERFNILHFYLIEVEALTENDINEFVMCNGLQVSVYNTRHPLNNRFKKYSID